MSDSILKELAETEYNYFVVNTYAVAIQAPNGIYYKKNIPLTPLLIQKMLENKGSMGCYQQGYKTDRLRWICFDFDCKDKDNPDLKGLYEECISPLTKYLEDHKIGYLTEFSGRRGIHVWIIFDKITTKAVGYQIMEDILNSVDSLRDIKDNPKWNLDRFPKTDSAKGNIVGSQVKFPLSMHQSGGRSYFFEGYFLERTDIDSESFYAEQLGLLNGYKLQDVTDVMGKIGARSSYTKKVKYSVYDSIENAPEELSDIIDSLCETVVYRNIFERMRAGRAQRYDWLVLLGTFVPFDKDGRMLMSLFGQYPNYDIEKTVKNVKKLRNKYYPARFSYLYSLYKIPMEGWLNPEDTGVDYLCRKLGGTPLRRKLEAFKSVNNEETDLQRVLLKERNYITDNDEVISVSIANKLSSMKNVELVQYDLMMERYAPILPKYERFVRHEDDKDRLLISLIARDRIITTGYALRLYDYLGYHWDSYSYQVSVMNKDYVFYQWYSSWGRFIAQLRVYMELPFMQDSYVFYIDLKQCYPHVDLLNVYRGVEGNLNEEANRIFTYLLDYNDRLMKEVQDGNRIGVPQGPAYARILVELYLDHIIKNVCGENINFRIFRYVDDIVVVCDQEKLAADLFQRLCEGFSKRNMPINKDKTRYYGKISDLSADERAMLMHADHFNYDLTPGQGQDFLVDADKSERLSVYAFSHPFDINLLGYLFGNRTFQVVQHYYFYNYGKQIMESSIGRGKSFRQFYAYVLDNSERIRKALMDGWFKAIPVDTVNYSNFISTLYYRIRNGMIPDIDVKRIVLGYLQDNVSYQDMSKEDYEVTQAIVQWNESRGKG